MIIGHLPAGYVISRLLVQQAARRGVADAAFIWAGVMGAIAPDFDMFYFHLIDQRQHHHHTYFTHYPVLWFALLVAAAVWIYLARTKNRAILAFIFSLNGFAHMFFDTIVGDVWWLSPWINEPFAFFTVPALYTPWWLNFILHWSFAVELAITAWAIYLWRKTSQHTSAQSVSSKGRVY